MKTQPRWAGLPVLFTLLLGGCGAKPEQRAADSRPLPTASVQVQVVQSKSRPLTEEVVGTVRARLHATLEAKVSGRIDRMPVVLGDAVRSGQLLVRLDAPEVKARLDQATASLEQAERDWKRVRDLFESHTITRAEYDAAEARLSIARGAVAEARALMGYCEVAAPFDGLVTRKWVEVGDHAAPGKPLLDLQDPAVLQLDADVPEMIGARIQRNASLTIHIDSLGRDLTGIVSELAPAADPVSRTFRVKLDLPQTPGLMAGQFARLTLPVGESASLRVPISTVVQRGQLELVFVAANQQAQMRLVKTGKQVGDEVEILSGLTAGETVVIDGARQLTDGQPVAWK
jgi:RND family efflux transporter MFP subunit